MGLKSHKVDMGWIECLHSTPNHSYKDCDWILLRFALILQEIDKNRSLYQKD